MFLLISHDFVLVGDNDKRKALVIALDERLKSLSGGCGRLPVAVVRAAFNFKDLNAQQFARAGASGEIVAPPRCFSKTAIMNRKIPKRPLVSRETVYQPLTPPARAPHTRHTPCHPAASLKKAPRHRTLPPGPAAGCNKPSDRPDAGRARARPRPPHRPLRHLRPLHWAPPRLPSRWPPRRPSRWAGACST